MFFSSISSNTKYAHQIFHGCSLLTVHASSSRYAFQNKQLQAYLQFPRMTSSIDPGIRSANRPLMALSSPIGNVILQKPKKWLLQNLQQPLSKSGLLQPPLSARQPIIRRPLPDIHAAVHFAASKFSPVSVNIQRTVYPIQRKRTRYFSARTECPWCCYPLPDSQPGNRG